MCSHILWNLTLDAKNLGPVIGQITLCILMCFFKLPLSANDLLQTSQLYGLSPVCVLMCDCKRAFWLHDFSRILHLNDLICNWWEYLHVESLPHFLHLYLSVSIELSSVVLVFSSLVNVLSFIPCFNEIFLGIFAINIGIDI